MATALLAIRYKLDIDGCNVLQAPLPELREEAHLQIPTLIGWVFSVLGDLLF